VQIPLGWWTDLEVARRSGAIVLAGGQTFVVKTPDNPGYYWGNYVLVPGDWPSARAQDFFAEQFPESAHFAVGLLGEVDPSAWAPWPVESNEVLTSSTQPQAPAVSGYDLRALSGDDWRQAWRHEVAGQSEDYADFAWRRIEARRVMVERGDAVFLGAFQGGVLAADLGIVQCGSVARYQSVFTHPDHRERGLASWLLARAGQWAGQRGAHQYVIVAEPGSPARRLYERLGFGLAEQAHQVERGPETAPS
jgi:GNAT superfamily N-acetyltransferase